MEKYIIGLVDLVAAAAKETDPEKAEAMIAESLDMKKLAMASLFARKTGEEAGQIMENFVNMMCNRKENEAFVEYIVHRTHRTLNQGLIGLFFDVIKEEAKLAETGRYDARNEASVMACKNLKAELEETYLPFI